MSRIRIEGLLAAFPKLVGSGKQHTYVETENVRYVYQPIDVLYLLLVTNKQSNILEDLDTLRLLSKVVPEYSPSLDEEGICKNALIFAFDEVISLGHKENVTVAQVKQYCEMESHEERLHKLVLQSKINETKDVMKRKANEIDKSKAMNKIFMRFLHIERDKMDKGGFSSLQSMGSMGSIGRMDSGFGNDGGISNGNNFGSGSGFGLSSEVDSFSTKSKDPNRPFPAGQSGDGLGLLKWRLQSKDESDVPLTSMIPEIQCWSGLYFSLMIPIAGRWSLLYLQLRLMVVSILPLRNGAAPKFSQRTQLVTESYQVV
ncbi:hypothetical protein L1987_61185 [Smallanthus sonchifolius]|uniref:Uncharacterized protein n=1 Tax=Smallanthus sonchifolius TaxID=185202 RepID=A0ACB9DAA7_9ASTR|nr:hypothetical protein L1987_61185 [Smallanthus sonchifolius]